VHDALAFLQVTCHSRTSDNTAESSSYQADNLVHMLDFLGASEGLQVCCRGSCGIGDNELGGKCWGAHGVNGGKRKGGKDANELRPCLLAGTWTRLNTTQTCLPTCPIGTASPTLAVSFASQPLASRSLILAAFIISYTCCRARSISDGGCFLRCCAHPNVQAGVTGRFLPD
jgi:hypothetical protein